MSKAKNELSVEEAFLEIDEIVKKLEDENISLEASFEEYKKGMELIKACTDKIDRVEKKVLALSEEGVVHEFE